MRLCGDWLQWLLEEGQTLLRSLATTPDQGQESVLQSYLSLFEQWEAEETTGLEAEPDLRRTVSLWGVMAWCLSRWRAVVFGQWSFAHLQVCLPRRMLQFAPLGQTTLACGVHQPLYLFEQAPCKQVL